MIIAVFAKRNFFTQAKLSLCFLCQRYQRLMLNRCAGKTIKRRRVEVGGSYLFLLN